MTSARSSPQGHRRRLHRHPRPLARHSHPGRLASGKDVYCEKPLTHNIHEAIEIMEPSTKHKRVLQTGSMQRSMSEFRIACELVRNGAIGKISHVECSFGAPRIPATCRENRLEPGLDWDMWAGPAPCAPTTPCWPARPAHHFPNWRTYKEYGGGMVCDWGAHHLDIAQWGLGMDDSGPVEVIDPAERSRRHRGRDPPLRQRRHRHHKDGFGVHFFGADGEVKVNRGRFEFILNGKKFAGFVERGRHLPRRCGSKKRGDRIPQGDAKIKLYEQPRPHPRLPRVRGSRKKPITNEIRWAAAAPSAAT
jgi:hypothetical protein